MISCTGCGRANDVDARYCAGCGQTLPVASAPLPIPPPPPGFVGGGPLSPPLEAAPPRRAPRSRRFKFRPTPRFLVGTMLLIAFVLTLISLGTAWWSYSTNTTGETVTVNFLPGSNYNVTCAGNHCGGFTAGSPPYSALGGSLGGVYETILVLVAVSAALAAFAALFGGLSALGRNVGGWARGGVLLFSGAAAIVLLVAVAWLPGAQPGAFPSGSSFTATSGGASPGTTYWGSNPAGTISWGAGVGWYAAVVSVALLLTAVALLMVLGRQRFTVPGRRSRSSVSSSAVPYRAYAPPPSEPKSSTAAVAPSFENPAKAVAPVAPEPAPSTAAQPCPNCGTENLVRSRTCSYCQRSLR